MSTISKQTATDIALHYREIDAAQELLSKVDEALSKEAVPDLRDSFGRRRGLQLGVPSGSDSHRMFDVPWSIARPVIEAHIAHHRAAIGVLSIKAAAEFEGVAE